MGPEPIAKPIEAPWSLEAAEVAKRLVVDKQNGLSGDEASRRLDRCGPNRIREAPGRRPLQIFLSQFADLMILLLAGAAAISAVIGEWADAVLIAVIVVANAVIGSLQEWRAEKAVAALRKLSQPCAHVWRDGQLAEIPAVGVVVGDLVELKGGDFVPADARLLEAADLQVDEAALTGESLPVEKSVDRISPQTALPDRQAMVYAGTAVTQGRGRAITTATGMETEIGKIATLLDQTETVQTPLQQRLAALSKRLALVVIGISIVIFLAGVLHEDPANWDRQLLFSMLLVAVSLAVAAIPEGLPAVITIALALGAQKTARRKAIVRRLSAVETLGSVDVICTDKTGTLTQNRMAVADLLPCRNDDSAMHELLRAGVLCNDAERSDAGELVGSATEVAILQVAIDRRLDPGSLRQQWPRLAETPFSSARKRMSTLHRSAEGRQFLFVKGAAEAILDRCDFPGGGGEDSQQFDQQTGQFWRDQVLALAKRGRRVLAVAVRVFEPDSPSENLAEAESSLTLLGLVGIVDPVRPEACAAIAHCRSAGIRTVMITGDHQATAAAIAEELDLWRSDDRIVSGLELDTLDAAALQQAVPQIAVFARVSPEHKLRIVQAYQSAGSVVAMTGDGVNDAPALKQADIGIAMGQAGTDVSKAAADTVLADDNFATIVAAVEEGRVVYDNIRKFVRYLLTANAGEILVLFLAIISGMPLPLLPVHILWINLVTDGLPALALGFEPGEQELMSRPPRPRSESIFAGGLARGIVLVGLLMGGTSIGIYQLYLSGSVPVDVPRGLDVAKYTYEYARTMVFLVLSLAQLFFVLAIRSSTRSFFELTPWSNYRLTLAVLLGIAVQLAVTYAPPLQTFFHTVALSSGDLAIGVAVSTVAFIAVELQKLVGRIRRR